MSKDSVNNIADLKFDPKNARVRTERSSRVIRTSLEKFGGMRSIVLDENNVIRAGNGTVEEAGQIGIEKVRVIDANGDEIIAVRRKGLTEAEWKEYAVADNRSSDLSEWDAEVLAELSEEIDLSGLFFEDELAELLNTKDVQVDDEPVGVDDEEAVADDLEKADAGEIESRVSLGQIWKLGRHYICCGDSTDEGNIQKLLAKAGVDKVGMVWADPPYGLADRWTGGTWGSNPMYGDAKKWDQKLSQASIDSLVNFCPVVIIWGANYYTVPSSRCWLAWVKSQQMETMADFELAWTNLDKVSKSFVGARNMDGKREHPTQKPAALAVWAFEKYGNSDDVIFDPFLGSGMSIIAAQQMGGTRRVVGFELSPEYCTIILNRFEAFTGINAELVGSL